MLTILLVHVDVLWGLIRRWRVLTERGHGVDGDGLQEGSFSARGAELAICGHRRLFDNAQSDLAISYKSSPPSKLLAFCTHRPTVTMSRRVLALLSGTPQNAAPGIFEPLDDDDEIGVEPRKRAVLPAGDGLQFFAGK